MMGGRVSMWQEILLRTACGCTKRVIAEGVGRMFRVSIQRGGAPTPGNGSDYWTSDVQCQIRDFYFTYEHDPATNLPVYAEDIHWQAHENEDWHRRYTELYNDVYGMDVGL